MGAHAILSASSSKDGFTAHQALGFLKNMKMRLVLMHLKVPQLML